MPFQLPYTSATLPPNVVHRTIETPQASIAAFVSTPPSPPPGSKAKPTLLLIHGNSASSLIWRHVFECPLAETHTIVAFDLPGHGASGDANEDLGVRKVYTQQAYARVALQVLAETVGPGEVVVLGWSLGGHTGIEMCQLLETEAANQPPIKITTLCIVGSPPVPLGGVSLGFYPLEHVSFAETTTLTPDEITLFAQNMTKGPYEPWMHDCVVRTDGRARSTMFATFRDGTGACDQKACVERLTRGTDTLVAVINGANEPFVNIKWIREGVDWGAGLWRGKCFEIGEGAGAPGHTPFWEDWPVFWSVFRELMVDAEGVRGSA